MSLQDRRWTVTVVDGETGNSYQIEYTIPSSDPSKWMPHADGHYYSDEYMNIALRLSTAARDCFKHLIDKRRGHS